MENLSRTLFILSCLIFTTKKLHAQDSTLIVPVVFHILHNYGNENISDKQIFRAVELLNNDFNLRNDTSKILPEFKSRVANLNIEFRLAQLGPNGNSTIGIERITTPITHHANLNNVPNPWDTKKYLNIWVAKSLTEVESALVSTPYDNEIGRCTETGIVILHNYLSDIGTGNQNIFHFFTAHVARFLGLKHTFGKGDSFTCGDDGIADTPKTQAIYSCDLTAKTVCDNTITSNIQNFLANSYCMEMFTEGQKEYLRNKLLDPNFSRNNLIKYSNLIATGVLNSVNSKKYFYSDFYADAKLKTNNKDIKLYNSSTGSDSLRFKWFMKGAIPETSTEKNPIIRYTEAGIKDIQLITYNDFGSDTLIKKQFIVVYPDYSDYVGAFQYDFEKENPIYIGQSENGSSLNFTYQKNKGFNGSTGYVLPAFNATKHPLECGEVREESAQIQGSNYSFITESTDLRGLQNAMLQFKFAFTDRMEDTNQNNQTQLTIYKSTDNNIFQKIKNLTGSELRTTGFQSNNYVPNSTSDWKTVDIPLTTNSTNNFDKVRFKVELTLGKYPNNFYFDDFSVTGTASLNDLKSTFNIYPNPVKSNELLSINNKDIKGQVTINWLSLDGQIVQSSPFDFNESTQVQVPNLKSGIYYFTITSDNKTDQFKVILLD